MKNRIVKTGLISVGILSLVLLFLFGALELTSKPTFCSNCHFMRPYIEAWKTSTHAEVTCTACHFPPGFKSKLKGKFTAASMVVNYFTGVYKKSKPWAEISDESCLRSGCHAERLLKDDVIFKEGILFEHKPHLTELRRDKELRCTSCHSQVVQGEHISVTESTCFLCHFKNPPNETPLNDCTWCHDAPVTTKDKTVDYDHTVVADLQIDCKKCHGKMQIGDGAVPRQRCSSCHAEIEKIKEYDNVELMHKNHVADHKVECDQCHSVIQHKSVSKTENIVPDCESCHSNMHSIQYGLFSGQIGQDISPHPDKMFEAGLTCQACHIFHEELSDSKYEEETAEPTGETCEKCHGKGYNKLFNQWQSVMANKLAIVKQSIETVEAQLAENEPPKLKKYIIIPLLDRAKYNYEVVERGNIVHNVAFSDQLLTKVSRDLLQIIDELNLEHKIPDLSQFAQVIPSECNNCHIAIESIEKKFDNIVFKHDHHIAKGKVTCSKCHSNATKHGEIIITRESCSSCHHEETEMDCEDCHTLQASIYSGSATWINEPYADVMSDEEVECMDCHSGDDTPLTDDIASRCEECHEMDEIEMMNEWQNNYSSKMNEISQILSKIPDYNLESPNYKRIVIGILNFRKDGSHGVHNSSLTIETLESYKQDLETLTQ
ncbi:MAG: cytochrome c3 family protein [Candidatus Marinimicrobia bacterium]|nr:cytochrome c3 family protein [Candidatus Neomarinimicrobiota bacterium]